MGEMPLWAGAVVKRTIKIHCFLGHKWYHPEGRNKIQDDYKPDLFEVTGKHSNQNAFFIKPLDGKGLVKQVNRRQMFDLGVTE